MKGVLVEEHERSLRQERTLLVRIRDIEEDLTSSSLPEGEVEALLDERVGLFQQLYALGQGETNSTVTATTKTTSGGYASGVSLEGPVLL